MSVNIGPPAFMNKPHSSETPPPVTYIFFLFSFMEKNGYSPPALDGPGISLWLAQLDSLPTLLLKYGTATIA